ncbi:MAG TPA: helix-turn-helix domain-containing protein [Caulobacteraceae bacterium]|nr:helix-turn-helix domain-containing protein [Caulobacteraceae bacterium]
MPLDTGAFVDGAVGSQAAPARRPRVVLDTSIDIGSALKRARDGLGLSLDDIAETTKVRARHLAAIENAALDQLPSRPFTIGYVRAYAKALGLDADATAARYRTEYPSPDDDDLRSPVGVRHDHRRGGGWLVALGGVALISVVGWNIAVRATTAPHHRGAQAARAIIAAPHTNAAANGPYSVDAPLPAPPEATAPAPYVTPVVGADAPANSIVPVSSPTAPAAPATPFVAGGAIYGPAAGASDLIIQAKKSISLEVRGPGGVVYFARQLAPGEAYRVPALPNLTAEVSNPASAELFEGGLSRGLFTAAQMPLKTTATTTASAG